MILSRFVRLFLLNLPCTDKDDTAESRKYHPFQYTEGCRSDFALAEGMAAINLAGAFLRNQTAGGGCRVLCPGGKCPDGLAAVQWHYSANVLPTTTDPCPADQ